MAKRYWLTYEWEGPMFVKHEAPVQGLEDRTFAHPEHAWRALELAKDMHRQTLRLIGYRVRLLRAAATPTPEPSKPSPLRKMLSWIRPAQKY